MVLKLPCQPAADIMEDRPHPENPTLIIVVSPGRSRSSPHSTTREIDGAERAAPMVAVRQREASQLVLEQNPADAGPKARKPIVMPETAEVIEINVREAVEPGKINLPASRAPVPDYLERYTERQFWSTGAMRAVDMRVPQPAARWNKNSNQNPWNGASVLGRFAAPDWTDASPLPTFEVISLPFLKGVSFFPLKLPRSAPPAQDAGGAAAARNPLRGRNPERGPAMSSQNPPHSRVRSQ